MPLCRLSKTNGTMHGRFWRARFSSRLSFYRLPARARASRRSARGSQLTLFIIAVAALRAPWTGSRAALGLGPRSGARGSGGEGPALAPGPSPRAPSMSRPSPSRAPCSDSRRRPCRATAEGGGRGGSPAPSPNHDRASAGSRGRARPRGPAWQQGGLPPVAVDECEASGGLRGLRRGIEESHRRRSGQASGVAKPFCWPALEALAPEPQQLRPPLPDHWAGLLQPRPPPPPGCPRPLLSRAAPPRSPPPFPCPPRPPPVSCRGTGNARGGAPGGGARAGPPPGAGPRAPPISPTISPTFFLVWNRYYTKS